MNALTTAGWGLTSAEHYYGLPEALFEDRVVQSYPTDYDYSDEYFRFAFAGQTFRQAAQPGSAKWNEVLDAFLALDFTFVPTFTIYDANRDLMRTRQADWHREYAWKSMWDYFQPRRGNHGSYWYRWSTTNEIEWKENYRLWMQFINEYKNRGGRVCTGSDSGFIYQLFGFGYIRELELLQEAGLPSAGSHPRRDLARRRSGRVVRRDRQRGGRQAGRPAGARPQSADRLQAAVRHRRDALQRRDAPGRMAPRAALHDQGRRDLRRGRTARPTCARWWQRSFAESRRAGRDRLRRPDGLPRQRQDDVAGRFPGLAGGG